MEESSIADWELTIQVNLIGVYYTCKYAIPDLKGKGGHIIVIGSGMGHRVVEGGALQPTAPQKPAPGCWCVRWRPELRPYGICVNELIPGLVRTDLVDAANLPDDSPLEVEWRKTPADVVPLALFLATQPPTGPTAQSFSLMRRDSQ